MRLRIVIPVLALGLLLMLAAWLLRPGRSESTTHRQPSAIEGAQPQELATRPGTPFDGLKPRPASASPQFVRPPPDTNSPGLNSPEARQQAYVEDRINQLMDLALDDQPASLDIILGELTNRDPDIRQAAVQAAMQFGSREAIPKLREAADQTDDPTEKAAIRDAIEFLEFPGPGEAATDPPGVAPGFTPRPPFRKR